MNRPPKGSNAARAAKGRIPPHDLDLERDILGGLLTSPRRDDAEALAGRDLTVFYGPGHRDIANAIVDLYLDNTAAAPPLGAVVERLTTTTGKDPATIRRDLLELVDGHDYYGVTIKAPLDTLERYRRQRSMLALAGELTDNAFHGTDWHTAAEEIFELAHLNGAVAKLSTLELIDLGPILRGEAPEVVPIWLRREDGRSLLYPGRLHDIHAEPSVGKTWLALTAAAEVLRAGGAVIYIDLEDSAFGIVDRLRRLNVPDELLDPATDRFAYINPAGGFQPAERNELFALMDRLDADLVVIDGVAEALARDGFDENSNTDVVLWAERVPRPLAKRGAAVLMLDHVTKNPEGRARGGRGAGAKLALIDGASFEARLAIAYSRSKDGLVKLVVAKDRLGLVGSIGETVADIRLEPQAEGTYLRVRLETPAPPGETTFRPSGVMERLSERLENADHPLPERWLVRSVRGKRPVIDEAIAGLLIDGYIEEVKDTTGRRAYRSVKPYRERGQRPPLDHASRAAGERDDDDRAPPELEPPPELFDEPPEE